MRCLSLFSGGGGLDLAAELLWPDLEHVAFSELDPHASTVLARWWPDVPNLSDVTTVDWNQLGPVDVLTAGFPCQDISHAGKRAGIKEGTRSGLWFSVVDALRVLRPRLVLLENVAAITFPGGGLDTVLGSLAEIGFDAEWGVLRASDVGAPHQRERWFCVAYPERLGSAGWRAPADVACSSRGSEGPGGERERDGDAAHDRGPTAAHTDRSGRGEHGGTEPVRSEQPTAERRGDVAWGEYTPAIRRWERVIGRHAPAPVDGHRLTPGFVEWMMGWPEGHVAGLSRSQALKVLGNGVVPLQAAHAYSQLLGRIDVREVAA